MDEEKEGTTQNELWEEENDLALGQVRDDPSESSQENGG